MARILVTPEELRSVAAAFKKSREESDAMIQNLAATIKNLDQNWDGMSSQKFYQNYEQWQAGMSSFVTTLEEIYMELLRVADRFEQADQSA